MPKQLAIPVFSQRAWNFGQFDIACPRNQRKPSSRYHIRTGSLAKHQFECTRQGQHEAVKDMRVVEINKEKHTAVAAKHTATLGTSREKTSGNTEPTDEGA